MLIEVLKVSKWLDRVFDRTGNCKNRAVFFFLNNNSVWCSDNKFSGLCPERVMKKFWSFAVISNG